ncbi:MAG: ApaG domain, partial [Flavobacteriales bacterium]
HGRREVEGPGVVGETPVLAPGEEFTYSSACDLRGAFGRMQGTYLMRRAADGSEFRVDIPVIQLSSDWASN